MIIFSSIWQYSIYFYNSSMKLFHTASHSVLFSSHHTISQYLCALIVYASLDSSTRLNCGQVHLSFQILTIYSDNECTEISLQFSLHLTQTLKNPNMSKLLSIKNTRQQKSRLLSSYLSRIPLSKAVYNELTQ